LMHVLDCLDRPLKSGAAVDGAPHPEQSSSEAAERSPSSSLCGPTCLRCPSTLAIPSACRVNSLSPRSPKRRVSTTSMICAASLQTAAVARRYLGPAARPELHHLADASIAKGRGGAQRSGVALAPQCLGGKRLNVHTSPPSAFIWTHPSPQAGTLPQRNLGACAAPLVHLCCDQQLWPVIEMEPVSPVWTLVPQHA
jgi:hypothetical protein